MTRFLATVGTIALLSSGSAFAQAQTDNQGSLDVIAEQLQTEFTQLGVDLEVNELTMDQARQAYLIVSDDSLTEDEQKQQLEALQTQ